jgi:hypothetical protein
MSATLANSSSSPSYRPRKFEALVALILIFPILYAALCAADFLFLIHLYGWSRIRGEHLHFTATPKAGDWIVSNGDRITEGHFWHFLVALILWLSLFFLTYGFIRRQLPERKSNEAPSMFDRFN